MDVEAGAEIHKHWKWKKITESTSALGVMKLFSSCVIFLMLFEGLGASMQCVCVCYVLVEMKVCVREYMYT